MAQLSYEQHLAQQAANRPRTNGEGPKLNYMGAFLKGDGDTVIVRFPYHSMDDITYTTTHNIPMPGAPFGRRIRCTGDDSCQFCQEGIKLDTRFFGKMIVYTVDETTGKVNLNCTVWDRPSAFADIDLKNLFDDYGDISTQLFKIKRSGSGTSTRYTISIILNKTVYNPAVYVADFTELDKIDAVKVLSKSITQYNEAMGDSTETKQVEEVKANTPFNNAPTPTWAAKSEPVVTEQKVQDTRTNVTFEQQEVKKRKYEF